MGISWGNQFGNRKLHENYQTSDGSDGEVIYKMDHHGSNWRNSKRKITRLYAGSMRALTKWLGLKNSHLCIMNYGLSLRVNDFKY